jgi:hypothetical protein
MANYASDLAVSGKRPSVTPRMPPPRQVASEVVTETLRSASNTMLHSLESSTAYNGSQSLSASANGDDHIPIGSLSGLSTSTFQICFEVLGLLCMSRINNRRAALK